MNNGFIHDNVLLKPIKAIACELGYTTVSEMTVRTQSMTGFIDLFLVKGSERIAIEIEMTSKRVQNDLIKARAAHAWLWIVVPNSSVQRSVRRQFARCGVRETNPAICCFTIPSALKQLRELSFQPIEITNDNEMG